MAVSVEQGKESLSDKVARDVSDWVMNKRDRLDLIDCVTMKNNYTQRPEIHCNFLSIKGNLSDVMIHIVVDIPKKYPRKVPINPFIPYKDILDKFEGFKLDKNGKCDIEAIMRQLYDFLFCRPRSINENEYNIILEGCKKHKCNKCGHSWYNPVPITRYLEKQWNNNNDNNNNNNQNQRQKINQTKAMKTVKEAVKQDKSKQNKQKPTKVSKPPKQDKQAKQEIKPIKRHNVPVQRQNNNNVSNKINSRKFRSKSESKTQSKSKSKSKKWNIHVRYNNNINKTKIESQFNRQFSWQNVHNINNINNNNKIVFPKQIIQQTNKTQKRRKAPLLKKGPIVPRSKNLNILNNNYNVPSNVDAVESFKNMKFNNNLDSISKFETNELSMLNNNNKEKESYFSEYSNKNRNNLYLESIIEEKSQSLSNDEASSVINDNYNNNNNLNSVSNESLFSNETQQSWNSEMNEINYEFVNNLNVNKDCTVTGYALIPIMSNGKYGQFSHVRMFNNGNNNENY